MSLVSGHAKSAVAPSGFYPQTIDQSLRFEDGDSAYLSRTPASAGNRKTWTWSAWVKLGNVSLENNIFQADPGNVTGGQDVGATIGFLSGGRLQFSDYTNAWYFRYYTTQLFRDPSAWYHVVVALDTTQATESDRIKIYINGLQVSSFTDSVAPSLDYESSVNNTVQHHLGTKRKDGSTFEGYFDGYLAEVHFTDGTAYTADAFGELKSGIWIPKAPSVTYGTNGFYLAFGDSAAIGDDTSGNGNDWTVNNLVASDVVLDSPTNNFATMNVVDKGTAFSLAEGNLESVSTSGSFHTARATMAVSSGKWYWEIYCEDITAGSSTRRARVGIATGDTTLLNALGSDAFSWGYRSDNGGKINDGNGVAYGDTFGTGNVIGVALDMDGGNLYFYKDNVIQDSGTAAATGLTGTWHPATSILADAGTALFTINFGQDSTFAGNVTAGGNTDANGIGDFKYTVPSGYLALCTSNLPDPAIDPAQDATPEDYFNTVLYSGNGSTQSITGVGFQPDWVWLKSRNNVGTHGLFDVVRGASKDLQIGTGAEGTLSGVSSFDSDGFSLGGSWNQSGYTFVGWNWKAGGTGVSNTDGSINSTVSANTDAGFSIVGYTGNGTAGATVGHGLSSAPEMVITKVRTITGGFTTYHKGVASDAETDYLYLNTTAAAADYDAAWNDTAPSSSVVTLGSWGATNYSAQDFIMYCFHSVDGFSKVGSYVGNGSTDGPFVYTGFRPKFVMVKNASATGDWRIWDGNRNGNAGAGNNVTIRPIAPNLSSAENTQTDSVVGIDMLSNGFKLRSTGSYHNGSGNTHIFLCFAESPFKYSNAR